MDLEGQPPKQPPVMPYKFRRLEVRQNTSSQMRAVFDGQSFAAGKTYNLNIKIKYLSPNGVREDTARVSILVPQEGEIGRADRAGGRWQAEKRAGGPKSPSSMGQSADADKQDPRMKGANLIRLRTAKASGGTEYNYTLRAQDSIIDKFILEKKEPIQVTGTPKGWIVLPNQEHTITWMTKDGIQPGKQLNGFAVVGSNDRTNLTFMLQGPGKAASGLIEGPGK